MELIKQGAEAKVYKTLFNDTPCIAKERLIKTYRLPELDQKLTKARMKQEARCLKICLENGIKTPEVYQVHKTNRTIYMEFIAGPSLRDFIIEKIENREEIMGLARQLGQILTKIHSLKMVHGGLYFISLNIGRSHDLEYSC
jgi:Kae1-associated kinase Bud32